MTDRVEPVVKFRFAVLIPIEKNGTKYTVGWFTECSGLNVERETVPRPEGGINDFVHQLPGRIKQSRITLKRGLADNVLWDWFQEGLYDGQVKRYNISIVLYNSDRTKKKQWDLENAYPVKWSGPDFQSDSNQVTIETLELVHHGLKMIDWADA